MGHEEDAADTEQGVIKEKNSRVLTPDDIKMCTDHTLLRYLRARDFSVVKAARMLRATLEWRSEEHIDDLSV